MDVRPQDFNRFTDMCLTTTKEEWIAEELEILGQDEARYDFVVDIGCGSYGSAVVYNRVLNVGHIYAIDVNENMIEYSKLHHPNASITYLLQDFAAEFDSFAPELKALEGKVDLIVALYCLHYICDEKRVANNMNRLLAKGGKVYLAIVLVKNPFDSLTGAEKERHEREWMKMPAVDTQRNQWLNAFKSVGFRVIVDKPIVSVNRLTQGDFENIYIPQQLTDYRRYYVNASDGEKVNAMDRRLEARLISNVDKYTDERTGAAMIKRESLRMSLVLQK